MEIAINSLRVKFHADIYITGSNSQLLSGELATYIAGRYISFIVYPFSFTELKMVNSDYTFDQYIQYGGTPFLSSIGFEPEVSIIRQTAPDRIMSGAVSAIYIHRCDNQCLR